MKRYEDSTSCNRCNRVVGNPRSRLRTRAFLLAGKAYVRSVCVSLGKNRGKTWQRLEEVMDETEPEKIAKFVVTSRPNRRPRSSRFEPFASRRSQIAARSIMLTSVPISPMTENHPHPSHYVASAGKTDSVIFVAVLIQFHEPHVGRPSIPLFC
jgi:hypothetical protein